MAENLITFLQPVVEQACQVLQIVDRDSNEVSTDDSIVSLCANIAYSQAVGYAGRRLAQDSVIELYEDVEEAQIRLRHTPVVEVYSVWNMEDEDVELVVDEDYEVRGNRLILLNFTSADSSNLVQAFSTGTSLSSSSGALDIKVSYLGGWLRAVDSSEVASALLMQTIANYHRKDSLGLVSVTGADQSGRFNFAPHPDQGEVVDSAKRILDYIRYYGKAQAFVE